MKLVGFSFKLEPYWLLAPTEKGAKCSVCFLPLPAEAYHLYVHFTPITIEDVVLKDAKMICCDGCVEKASITS